MKAKNPNAELVWKQLEDQLAPRLQFSLMGVGCNIRLSAGPVRRAVRRLVAQDALRMIQRSKAGHLVEVRLPDEIPAAGLTPIATRDAAKKESTDTRAPVDLDGVDFM